METRKETLTALKLCRFCLSDDETLTSLYDRSRAPKNSVPLPLKILSCVSIEVFPSDRMPSYICNRCKFFMDISYEYKQMCRQADENVLQYIQTGTDLSSVAWPSSLQKLFRVATKSAPELAIMKTVVEGGATVQVTAQESDSEEEDDENVYNVKIGDGSDEGPKNARVKVITADKSAKGKPKPGKDSEPARSYSIRPSTEQWEAPRPEPRAGRWPCDLCDCTYPLQQLLKLHKAQKHRERTVQCEQCDAKFFNTYDLSTHQLRHNSDDMVFQCAACGKLFKRLILLKRHEKLVHSDLAQIACPSCPATFLTQEELNSHEQKHILAKQRRFACDICDKRFLERSTLQRHKVNVHDKGDAFSCVYCPARFPSVTKLTRHVRGHAGDRSYPCKYCNKSFIKSHHYTRHLRLKHHETIRTCRGPFGETSDQYRCEQCEDTFATQDELIYHSAIHATQNLTCPLCQEKFEDVDAVTSHIKSHVNGTEFMCELCELVFTSRDKLHAHIAHAHDDEISKEDLAQDDSSVEMEVEDDEDDTGIQVKEEDDHMVVEIKKADDFMLSNDQGDTEDKVDNTNSEDSDSEITYTDISVVDNIEITRKEPVKAPAEKTATPGGAIITKTSAAPAKPAPKPDNQTAPILRRAEEIKRKAQPPPAPAIEKKNKVESNNTGASDKSLRLLEKELQELKRTNTRSEVVKTPAKPVEPVRNRRPQIHTSTPKVRNPVIEEKKVQVTSKSPALEKKVPERRVVTKENKEPKEVKDSKGNNGSVKDEKEVKEKDTKETPKSVVKNGAPEKNTSEEGIRRSTRPSKIKDYAKMIRDRTQDSDEDEDSDEIDEEYRESDRSTESRTKSRRASVKAAPKPAPAPAATGPATTGPAATGPAAAPGAAPAPRKRGRPRKDASLNTSTPAKVKKDNEGEETKPDESKKDSERENDKSKEIAADEAKEKVAGDSSSVENKAPAEGNPGVLVSPTGQTLKKIPIKALPPGVKPLPLPVNARPMGGGEVCEMQIGKKVVKVQKIVMTKAEVEAMAKKGLVEMKDGTMVLKQGIKIPTSDPSAIKNLVGDETKESPIKKGDKATPTRCDIDDESTQ